MESIQDISEEQPLRTADGCPALPTTLGSVVLEVTRQRFGTALQFHSGASTSYVSFSELGTIATEIARGLIKLGIELGDRVAIIGQTSAEWTMADCGALVAGAVVVPIYPTNSPEECVYVLQNSGAKLVFADAEAHDKIRSILDRCPELEQLVLLENDERASDMTMATVRRLGAEVGPETIYQRLAMQEPDAVATLVYTSGTSGPPKGCMLSHRNLLAASQMYREQLQFGPQHSLFQFLPLAHVLARVAQMAALTAGVRIIYWSGDMARIAEDLTDTAPTHFPAVPRVFEKIQAAVLGQLDGAPRAQKELFRWALSVGARARPTLRAGALPGVVTDLQYRLADRLVLSRVRQIFGAHHQLALVGAAPVAPELLEFFDACGVLILEGYGLTETCAAAAVNTVSAVRFGTVGKALPGTEIMIDGDGDSGGEILIRGPQVFLGYWQNEGATASTLTADHWLRTGDLGQISADGFLSITGRKKDLIITSSGKNIAPDNIESELRQSRFVNQAVIFGDDRPYLVALLTLDEDEGRKLAQRLGLAEDPALFATDPAIHAELAEEIQRVNAKFAPIEQVKRFVILDHDLSQGAGELTPTMKVKRNVVYAKYADVFAGLYEQRS